MTVVMQGRNTHPIPPPACGGRGFSPRTLQWVSHKGSLHIDHCVAPKTFTTMATKKTIPSYENRNNVTELVSDNGTVSYLTESVSYADKKHSLGFTKVNTYEENGKHVLFLMSSDFAVLHKAYMCKSLQGQTPGQIVAQKAVLCFFESFNPNTNQWVPCVSISNGGVDLSAGAVDA